jgi:hypothetical protein
MMNKGFEMFMDMASKFVEQNKGTWDHKAWMDFMNNMQRKGLEMNPDMMACTGTVLECMKKYYGAASNTQGIMKVMSKASENMVDFVKDNKGMWDHARWESFVQDMQKKGIEMNDQTTAYLGGILEAAKGLYSIQVKPAEKSK